jgi:hypothetical protein
MRSLKSAAIAAIVTAGISAVGAATALAAVETGTYDGTTTQVENGVHGKVKLVVPSQHKVKLFKYQFHAVCQNHSSGYTNSFAAHNGPLNNKGHFEDAGTFTFTGPAGTTGHAKVAIVGDVNSNGAAQGAFGVKVTFTNPDGSINDKCHTGIIDWHAHRS